MKKPSKCFVYIYLDPRKPIVLTFGEFAVGYEPFYVGKGTNYRHKRHLYGSHSRHLNAKIASIGRDGLTPIIQILKEDMNSEEALQLEQLVIKQIGRRDYKAGPLINHTDGGENGDNKFVTEETKAKLRAINTGKKHSPETIAKMSASRLGRVVSEETRQKISQSLQGHTINVGRRHTEETKAKMRKPKSELAVANMKAGWCKRSPMTEQQKEKIRATLTGRKLSEETKAKLRGKGANAGSFVKGQTPWNKRQTAENT